jgi:hypothetical protein
VEIHSPGYGVAIALIDQGIAAPFALFRMIRMCGPAVRCKRTFIESADMRSCINLADLEGSLHELGRSKRCDEFHSRALHCLGNRFGIPDVILLSLRIRAHVLHQPCVVSEHLQLATEMMRPDAEELGLLHRGQAPSLDNQIEFLSLTI